MFAVGRITANREAPAVPIPVVALSLAALKVNPATEDKGKRSHRDEKPEKDTLEERASTHFAESLHGEPCSNQVERDGQANNAKMLQDRIRASMETRQP